MSTQAICRYFSCCLIVFGLLPISENAHAQDFNFYNKVCTTAAENGCKAELVRGGCIKEVNGACRSWNKKKKCSRNNIGSALFPTWQLNCDLIKTSCKAYKKVCKEYSKVCKAGYKEVCEDVLKPFPLIADEIYWLAYKNYMGRVGQDYKGKIHPTTIKDLQPYYKSDLKVVDVSFGSALDGSSITDCNHIHFNDPNLVNILQKGSIIQDNASLELVLHELQHVDQCAAVGGRKKYAIMWFSQLETTLRVRVDAVIADTLTLGNANAVHDAMPMEDAAIDFASKKLPVVTKETRHGK